MDEEKKPNTKIRQLILSLVDCEDVGKNMLYQYWEKVNLIFVIKQNTTENFHINSKHFLYGFRNFFSPEMLFKEINDLILEDVLEEKQR